MTGSVPGGDARVAVRTTPGRRRVVIVGGGFGGLQAARALRWADVDVVLVDRRNHHVFQPLLYQVATAGLSPGDIASPIRWILRRQQNVQVLLGEAQRVDTQARVLHLDVGQLGYDALILATGATHAYFGHDEWQAHAPGLKTLEDAGLIRRHLLLAFEEAERTPDAEARSRALTFVIVGGGPTGVELAGALAELANHSIARDFRAIDTSCAQVLLVEAGPRILGAFPEDLQARAEASLVRLGVKVRKQTPVTAIDAQGVTLADGSRIEASTVLWAAGVAASPLGRSLGVEVDRVGRVIVQPDLTVPGLDDVYVVGDLAHVEQDGRLLPGVAQVAMQQGAHAVENILRRFGNQPPRPFRYHDLGNLATIGRHSAIADFGGRWRFSGALAWWLWLFIHVLKLTGFRNRLAVLVQWAWAYLTHQRGIRLITGQDPVASSPPSSSSPSPR
ncbi:NADH dehydrogenase [Luteitalea sp. TBR-22]|uniref:NAD(P)/FAD-dependent oxidoreductase n=1 Tax=Luteitalea sp. TBR-22 TaxID=2802971 RepID=UPI001AF1D06A|nr:NAD(P)/FAD-dependent oxidoreductase [Luteitalea sp. TBR-22]BCS32841.1 NADH dehydrogenase [Luteitalea sp. TBR-22]